MTSQPDFTGFYRGRRVLVTGGLGFIGGNLGIALAELGARVTVVDASIPGCGANPFNLAPVSRHVEVIAADIADTDRVGPALQRVETIFNLAGEVSHIHSMLFPQRDLEINTRSQLAFLETVAQYAPPRTRVVYASTRQLYGAHQYLPADERHPVLPADYNGVHKFAAGHYHSLLTRLGRIDAISLRLSNVYGPRMALAIPCQGFLSVFTARALLGQGITVFGDGTQLRDPVFVADACDAFLRAGMARDPEARLINIGARNPTSVGALAQRISYLAGLPAPVTQPFPDELKQIDIGDYYSDGKLAKEVLGWAPRMPLDEGLERTLAFHQSHLEHYLPGRIEGRCPLHELP